MKPALLLLACGTAIAFVPKVWAGLDLSWNACNLAPGSTSGLNFACADPDSSQHLFGSFQLPADMSGFLAMDLFIDVKSASSALPHSWHYEPDGCNDGALTLSAARPPGNEACQNPWGVSGATAYIAGYSTGFGGDPSRARLVASVFRQRPIYLTAAPTISASTWRSSWATRPAARAARPGPRSSGAPATSMTAPGPAWSSRDRGCWVIASRSTGPAASCDCPAPLPIRSNRGRRCRVGAGSAVRPRPSAAPGG